MACASSCPAKCEPVNTPVCGSDDKTYRNVCSMLHRNCNNRNVVRVKHFGKCSRDTNDNSGENCLRIGRRRYLKC
ncbi:Ovomucoid [Exaiptasia diaphana]|nr:Ovomucoid [Exaiptasia diaphana]